ncbi:unnamed protein product [Boreogadus saida]
MSAKQKNKQKKNEFYQLKVNITVTPDSMTSKWDESECTAFSLTLLMEEGEMIDHRPALK